MDIYKGTELKVAITLEANGFDMDKDGFRIEVASLRDSVYADTLEDAGGDQYNGIILYKDLAPVNPQDDSAPEVYQWYAIIDTSRLSLGDLRMIATAYVPDAHADGGIRSEIAVAKLCKLVNP